MTKGEGKAGTRPGRPTLVATRPPTRNERKQATRQELIQATIDAIAEGGLSALTLGKITQRADLSRGLVNFHFRHKEQLLVERFGVGFLRRSGRSRRGGRRVFRGCGRREFHGR